MTVSAGQNETSKKHKPQFSFRKANRSISKRKKKDHTRKQNGPENTDNTDTQKPRHPASPTPRQPRQPGPPTTTRKSNPMSTPLAADLVPEVSSWVVKKPSRNKFGGYAAYISRTLADRDAISFQAMGTTEEPKCFAPFGVSAPYDPARMNKKSKDERDNEDDGEDEIKEPIKNDFGKRNFELKVTHRGFIDFLRALDTLILEQAIRNYKNWFNAGGSGNADPEKKPKKKKKEITEDSIREYFRPLLQEDLYESEESGVQDSEKYMVRTKVYISGTSKTQVYLVRGFDADGNMQCSKVNGPVDKVILPGSQVVPVLTVGSVWFMKKEFGGSLQCSCVVVFPRANRNVGQVNWGSLKVQMIEDEPEPDVNPREESASAYRKKRDKHQKPLTFADATKVKKARTDKESESESEADDAESGANREPEMDTA